MKRWIVFIVLVLTASANAQPAKLIIDASAPGINVSPTASGIDQRVRWRVARTSR